MTSETAEAKKGTWKGRGRCIPGQRHKEEAKPGASPTFLRVKGAGVCTSSPLVSQPIQGIGRERELLGRNRAAGCQLKDFWQFQTNWFMYIPTSNSQRFFSPENSFLLLLTPEVFLDMFSFLQHLANDQAKLADRSQDGRRKVRTASVKGGNGPGLAWSLEKRWSLEVLDGLCPGDEESKVS